MLFKEDGLEADGSTLSVNDLHLIVEIQYCPALNASWNSTHLSLLLEFKSIKVERNEQKLRTDFKFK